jgi:TolA-binding protein
MTDQLQRPSGARAQGRGRGILLALLACSALSGCFMSASAGEELRAEALARDERISTLEERSEQKARELEDLLQRATAVVTRNSADAGAQVEALREQLAKLEGVVEELRHKVETFAQEQATYRAELEQRMTAGVPGKGGKPAIDPASIPADAEGHYKAGQAAYQAAENEKARALFREFLVRYPNDAKAGNAQYWIGASYLQESKPAAALGELRKVISDYGKSTAVNVALYGMADAFFRLHACSDAQSAADALIKRKPDAALLQRIKKLVAELKAAPKGSCTS